MKYSVIIPVYNAEKTLDRCVQSLAAQRYEDAEIILINDGSKDRSGEICQMYADRYPQIRYINKENGGVSSARNAGLDIATGEYILFVDSDDYVADGYFSILDQIDAKWDYAVASYVVTDGKNVSKILLDAYEITETDLYFTKISELAERKITNGPCNKRYKRMIVQNNQIRFQTGLSIGEDALFNLQYALHCCSCCIIGETLYYVSVESSDSLSRKHRTDLKKQIALYHQEMRKATNEADITETNRKKLLFTINFLQMSEVYSEAKRMHKAGVTMGSRWKEIGRLCDEFNQKNLKLPDSRYCRLLHLPVKLRLTFLLDLAGWKLAR